MILSYLDGLSRLLGVRAILGVVDVEAIWGMLIYGRSCFPLRVLPKKSRFLSIVLLPIVVVRFPILRLNPLHDADARSLLEGTPRQGSLGPRTPRRAATRNS